jgi:hypothetical protein
VQEEHGVGVTGFAAALRIRHAAPVLQLDGAELGAV